MQVSPHRDLAKVEVPLAGSGADERSFAALAELRERVLPAALGRVSGVSWGVTGETAGTQDEETARELASGYGLWVLGIRSGEGADPFPSPAEARAHEWTDEERALVDDRVSTQVVGAAADVVEHLDRIIEVTDADEIVVTTMTHDHADRVRSYELLAKHWDRWP